MKTAILLALLFKISICWSSLQATPTNGFYLTVELQDGSRVIGKAIDDKFEFRSEILGRIKLPIAQIVSVEFQPRTNTVKLISANGDSLAVLLVTKEIDVETSFGKVSLPADSIRRLRVSIAGTSGRTKAGLVALWSGEGDANDSVGGNNGQLVNDAGFASGEVGQAFNLNASLYSYYERQTGGFSGSAGYSGGKFARSGGYVLVPAGQALDVGKGVGLTFEFWIKPSIVTAEMMLFEFERALGTFSGSDVGVNVEIQPANPDLGAGNGGILFANLTGNDGVIHLLKTPPNLLKPRIWQHIAITYDQGSGNAIIYLNGKKIAEDVIGKFEPQTSFPNLVIGARTTFHSADVPGNQFVGALDEFGIYNRALSAAEIQAICTGGIGGQPLTPVDVPR